MEKNISKNEKASNVMLLDFSKFGNVDDIKFAFNVISTKKKKKTRYIQDAVEFYEKNNPQKAAYVDKIVEKNKSQTTNDTLQLDKSTTFDSDTNQTFSYMRYLNYIKKYYKINDRKTLETYLNIDKESNEYLKIKETADFIFNDKNPAKMSCGFTKNDDKATKYFEKFINMTMNDRIEYISKAIKFYVDSEMDINVKISRANKIFVDIIEEYQQSSEDKKECILNNLEIFFKNCESIKKIPNSSTDEDLVNNELSQETKDLLWGQKMAELDDILK